VSFLFQSQRSPATFLNVASPAKREELPQGVLPRTCPPAYILRNCLSFYNLRIR